MSSTTKNPLIMSIMMEYNIQFPRNELSQTTPVCSKQLSSGNGPLVSSLQPRSGGAELELNLLLVLFYERHVQWLVVPIHCHKMVVPLVVPSLVESFSVGSSTTKSDHSSHHRYGHSSPTPYVSTIIPLNMYASFALEVVSFCVRAHRYRIKFFLLSMRLFWAPC